MRSIVLAVFLLCAVLAMEHALAADPGRLLAVDAASPAPPPLKGHLRMGTSVSPQGHEIGINSRYLIFDGKPWLPVMGEFHYTRYPAQHWEEELLKMKTAGVTVVASYIIWQHHEETPGNFNWRDDRDLRRFVELCKKHELEFVVRVGPWSHAEVRFGGMPDWVVNAMPTRGDDAVYLRYVSRFYREIAAQLRGLLWKEGGPVIGVQLENEYNLTGPGQGRQHIATLKKLARDVGLDVPLYTVTGWDETVYPHGEVVPVFGGYPDEPWKASTEMLPPKETYAFRFDSRVSGNLGAQTKATSPGDADADMARTPFLGAEYGGGVPAMYRRRAVITPDDIGAMLPVQLGSGVNLYGYYMFHGGRNPSGLLQRDESTASGGYNDVPLIGYDFTAPLGQYGQMRPVLGKIRPVHYFLEAFGPKLAPMIVRRPAVTPAALNDLQTPRFAVRSLGDSGFLFFNSHVRQHSMAAQRGLRFEVRFARSTVRFPSRPIDVPSGAYFIWPINMQLGPARLAWATAQPITHVSDDSGEIYVFHAIEGVPVELAFDASTVASLQIRSGSESVERARRIVSDITPGTGEALQINTRSGKKVRVIVLTPQQAERLVVGEVAGARRLVLSDDDVFLAQGAIELRARHEARFDLRVFPALKHMTAASLQEQAPDGVFQVFTSRESPHARMDAKGLVVEPLREARVVPPIVSGGPAKAAMQPAPEAFGRSAAWTISVPPEALKDVNELFLRIDYRGDIARLFADTTMLDDHYYDGVPWEVGLKRFSDLLHQPLTLTVLPLRQDAPIYIQQEYKPQIESGGQIAALAGVTVAAEYRLRVETGSAQ